MNLTDKRKALDAHSWIGVFLGGLLYLVCLSGTLVVFHQEFERWEQPGVPEMPSIETSALDEAINRFYDKHPEQNKHFYVVFPTSGIPRVVVENENVAYFANEKGELVEQEHFPLTQMLIDLHYYLHLPKSWGMIFVSALGAMICALVISGVIAHKRLVKDVFRLRLNKQRIQHHIDLHNRFGLWAAPFHLIIGVTGTYFGLAGVLVVLAASLYHEGDREAVTSQVFTPDPVLQQPIQRANVTHAFSQISSLAPDSVPIFLSVHEVNTPEQFIEIYVKQPGQFIYSENYRFDSQGNFIGTAGYSDGEWGKQLVYSMYRLHFGDFAGLYSKLIYFVLGLTLTYLCVSGMNIWILKQQPRESIRRMWAALVWSPLLMTAVCAVVAFWFAEVITAVFWSGIILSMACGYGFTSCNKAFWLKLTGTATFVLLVAYASVNTDGMWQLAALQVNIPLLLAGTVAVVIGFKKSR